MQVNRLKRTLPSDARVGTAHKFQGQEAELAILHGLAGRNHHRLLKPIGNIRPTEANNHRQSTGLAMTV